MPPSQLGPTLRAWRERMPDGSSRYTPGLRREELAARAGISADYVIQLEQGRAKSPSEQVLRALARALDLSDPERDHLYELAGHRPPPPPSPQLPAAILRMLPQLHLPALLCNAAWDMITWNPAWAKLIGDVRGLPVNERNLVLRHFWGLPEPFRRNAEQRATFEAGIVADLRRSLGRNDDDPRLRAVVSTLLETSERFRTVWASAAASPYEREVKTFVDPELGSFDLDCVVMDTRRLDYRVILLSAPPGSVGEAKLRQVA